MGSDPGHVSLLDRSLAGRFEKKTIFRETEGLTAIRSNRRITLSMVLELAILNVKPGQTDQFEANFKLASPLIASMEGYVTHSLNRCIEDPDKYALLVTWETLEDHTVRFRNSPNYQKWKELLHHFYDPFPVVEHFNAVDLAALKSS